MREARPFLSQNISEEGKEEKVFSHKEKREVLEKERNSEQVSKAVGAILGKRRRNQLRIAQPGLRSELSLREKEKENRLFMS